VKAAGFGREAANAVLSLRGFGAAPPGVDRLLLDGVDLDLQPGERLAVTGASGSGKTTFLRTLCGQLPPRAGHMCLAGEDLAQAAPAQQRAMRRRIALVAQQHDLVEPLPVHANVMAGALGRWSNLHALRYLIRPRAEELAEAEAALELVGLAGKLREPTGRLSGGEQQRVAIARALVQAPVLLLADEPVASLDPRTANAVLGLLTRLARERGMGLICSLHQPRLAERYFDRVLELRDERLEAAAIGESRSAAPERA
jgi:phosphonate transport system ATP-binding protein